jgi:hypothetical protein
MSLNRDETAHHSRISVLIAVCLAGLVLPLSFSGPAMATLAISKDLGGSPTALNWITNAFMLVFGSCLMSAGALSDEFGRKRIFVGGVTLFAVVSLAIGLLALHIDEPSSASDYRHKIRAQWLLASKYNFVGAVPHDLEEFTATTEGFDIVRKAVNSLSRMIGQLDQPIQHQTLNLMGFEALWLKDIAVHELQEFAIKFDHLLESRIFTTASD